MNTKLRRWMVSTLGPQALAPLTGQDAAALEAVYFAALLWGKADGFGRQRASSAVRSLTHAMQATQQHLAIGAVIAGSHMDRDNELLTPVCFDPAVLAEAATLLLERGYPVHF